MLFPWCFYYFFLCDRHFLFSSPRVFFLFLSCFFFYPPVFHFTYPQKAIHQHWNGSRTRASGRRLGSSRCRRAVGFIPLKVIRAFREKKKEKKKPRRTNPSDALRRFDPETPDESLSVRCRRVAFLDYCFFFFSALMLGLRLAGEVFTHKFYDFRDVCVRGAEVGGVGQALFSHFIKTHSSRFCRKQ